MKSGKILEWEQKKKLIEKKFSAIENNFVITQIKFK